jgi:peptidoglycan hydrolase-like protein with peptidoglycan-binding domain
LQNGSTGNQARFLQTGLTILGYTLGSIDGDFGPKTLNAVKQFQNDKGLSANGIVDNDTWSKLLSSF